MGTKIQSTVNIVSSICHSLPWHIFSGTVVLIFARIHSSVVPVLLVQNVTNLCVLRFTTGELSHRQWHWIQIFFSDLIWHLVKGRLVHRKDRLSWNFTAFQKVRMYLFNFAIFSTPPKLDWPKTVEKRKGKTFQFHAQLTTCPGLWKLGLIRWKPPNWCSPCEPRKKGPWLVGLNRVLYCPVKWGL